jgi:hypothetical protein
MFLDWFASEQWRVACSPRLSQGPLFLIYQMPKAGSQTVEATLRALYPEAEIHRLHFLSTGGEDVFERLAGLSSTPDWMSENFRYQCSEGRKLRLALRARRWYRLYRVDVPKVHVITSLREPAGLMLSQLFQWSGLFFDGPSQMNEDYCRELLLQSPGVPPDRRAAVGWLLDFVQNWFPAELGKIINIDLLRQPAPTDKGYLIVENSIARVLFYRFENIRSLSSMLGEFLQIPPPPVINRNVGDAKEYAREYQQVRQTTRLPASFLQQQYSTGMMRHFYTEKERREFMQRWMEAADPKLNRARAEVSP